ncbi:hypothetical protein I79_014964 [Cricetulus griseus]|uniref:Uncharacterized protein n=1 Tax=Cricetulus griseus TaxID=10029 RepID=G3HVH6_CRIGR|nr:hypothetical protein I79_014964 [Cricetulus griseus]
MIHTFNPSTPHSGGRGRRIFEFRTSLVYRANSRRAKDTQKNPVLKQTNNNNNNKGMGVVEHAFSPSTREVEAGRSEFEASLVYKVSSRAARAKQRNPI